jgi:hypothetical protein
MSSNRPTTHLDLAVLADPSHNPVHHAPHDLCRILQRLIHTELDILTAQEHRVSTKQLRRRLAGHAGPRRPLREDHGNCPGAEGRPDRAGREGLGEGFEGQR